LQHFESGLMKKRKQCKIVIFGILRRPPVPMVKGNLRLIRCFQRVWFIPHLCQVLSELKQFS
jgi:hypothetical protein